MHKRIGVLMYQTSTSKGQELVAQRMVRDFISLGHEAYLITSVFHDGKEVISSENLTKGKGYIFVADPELGIPVIRVASYVVKWPRRRISFRDFVHVLERIVDEFKLNVLITHSTLWNGPEEVAKFVAWRRYMKDLGGYVDPIVFCHMSHFQEPSAEHYPLVERTFRMAWNRLSLSQILKTANLVLVVTPIEKETKIKMGADPKKCFLFPGGVNEELFLRFAAADTEDFLKGHQISKNAKLVSYLGTLEERKNPMAVLRIAAILKDRPDIHFVIAGRGGSRYADRLKEKASQLPNVTYVGELDEKDKTSLIKSSFANILMSEVEALGLSQLEFMYMGVPVVTSGVGGQSWLVRNGREGIHTEGPEDVDGAAKAIRNLADDPELWNRLSVNAKERARDMASYKIIRELDDAITGELVKESGLMLIPPETILTLAEPEHVLKTWAKGSWGVVATDRRLFIRHGRISRKVTEIPYKSIVYIEHTRRYPWKILLAGLLPAFVLLLEPLWRYILKSTFISVIETLTSSIITIVPQLGSAQMLVILVASIPCLISIVAFAVQARTGFNLQASGIKLAYLPHGFREAIAFIRSVQDEQNAVYTEDVQTRLQKHRAKKGVRTPISKAD
ncbi:MAG: glycosyltransferase [Candidatus Bathyarchaeia archaeon]